MQTTVSKHQAVLQQHGCGYFQLFPVIVFADEYGCSDEQQLIQAINALVDGPLADPGFRKPVP